VNLFAFLRRRAASDEAAPPAPPPASLSRSEWATVGPVQRVLGMPSRVSVPERGLDLAAHADPRLSGELGHARGGSAPSGLVHGLLNTRVGGPQRMDLDMPTLHGPTPVDRGEPTGAEGSSVGAASVGAASQSASTRPEPRGRMVSAPAAGRPARRIRPVQRATGSTAAGERRRAGTAEPPAPGTPTVAGPVAVGDAGTSTPTLVPPSSPTPQADRPSPPRPSRAAGLGAPVAPETFVADLAPTIGSSSAEGEPGASPTGGIAQTTPPPEQPSTGRTPAAGPSPARPARRTRLGPPLNHAAPGPATVQRVPRAGSPATTAGPAQTDSAPASSSAAGSPSAGSDQADSATTTGSRWGSPPTAPTSTGRPAASRDAVRRAAPATGQLNAPPADPGPATVRPAPPASGRPGTTQDAGARARARRKPPGEAVGSAGPGRDDVGVPSPPGGAGPVAVQRATGSGPAARAAPGTPSPGARTAAPAAPSGEAGTAETSAGRPASPDPAPDPIGRPVSSPPPASPMPVQMDAQATVRPTLGTTRPAETRSVTGSSTGTASASPLEARVLSRAAGSPGSSGGSPAAPSTRGPEPPIGTAPVSRQRAAPSVAIATSPERSDGVLPVPDSPAPRAPAASAGKNPAAAATSSAAPGRADRQSGSADRGSVVDAVRPAGRLGVSDTAVQRSVARRATARQPAETSRASIPVTTPRRQSVLPDTGDGTSVEPTGSLVSRRGSPLVGAGGSWTPRPAVRPAAARPAGTLPAAPVTPRRSGGRTRAVQLRRANSADAGTRTPPRSGSTRLLVPEVGQAALPSTRGGPRPSDAAPSSPGAAATPVRPVVGPASAGGPRRTEKAAVPWVGSAAGSTARVPLAPVTVQRRRAARLSSAGVPTSRTNPSGVLSPPPSTVPQPGARDPDPQVDRTSVPSPPWPGPGGSVPAGTRSSPDQSSPVVSASSRTRSAGDGLPIQRRTTGSALGSQTGPTTGSASSTVVQPDASAAGSATGVSLSEQSKQQAKAAAPADGALDIDDLARRLYPLLLSRLRDQLRTDRERAGRRRDGR
jgi:hypothetical protein